MAQGPVGAITALYGDLLCGWAFDPVQADQRLAVEIQLDGQPVAVARADQWQPAVESLPGDGFHGFAIQLKPSWLQRGRRLSAWVANLGVLLDGQIDLTARPEAKPALPVAEVRFDGGLRVLGWVWDPLEPNRHVRVRAYEHERCLAETIADRLHPALIDRPTADHGFILDLPRELADGERHPMTLVDDQGQPLPGGRVTVCFWPDGLGGLLRKSLPAGTDSERARRALLLRLADHQEWITPKAVDFADYPHWHALHEQPEPLPAKPSPLRVGVLIYDATDDGRQARSHDSLAQQRWSPHAVRACAEHELLGALAQLLAAGSDAVTLLRSGDQLAPNAIDALVVALQSESSAAAGPSAEHSTAWVYADSDRDDGNGSCCDPWLKPAWDPDLFFGTDLISSGCLLSAALVRRALRQLEPELAPRGMGLSLHWLLAAVVAITLEEGLEVVHLPRVLYRRAAAPSSAPTSSAPVDEPAAASGLAGDQGSDAIALARQPALQWLAGRLAPGARVEGCPGHNGLNRVVWPLPARLPTLTCIVPTRDRVDLLRPCIEGLLSQTDYPPLDVIVIDNGSCCPKTRAYLAELPSRGVRVLAYPHPFNYSTMNNLAVSMAQGELICLLNNDVQVREAHWLKAMVRELLRPGIGAVGAKLLWPNAMVQHGGVILGIHGLAAHVGNQWQIHDAGYLGFNQITRRYSAVTAACLLIRRSLYQELGGLNAVDFPVTFNDVDLCLRIRAQGLALVWTPFARLEHLESASRGRDEEPAQAWRARREQERLRSRWCNLRAADPAYHPALAHDLWSGPYGALHMSPASRRPRLGATHR